ncbi:MAG: hypothetical protein M5U26_16830 [Planctomycetota bacterium]|nr:hypothetical protein [Planctomycetota bacterium]
MSIWSSVRDARAEAACAVFAELGVRVDLIHEGAAAENLAAYLERAGQAFEATLTRHGVEETRTVHLPRQAGFAGAVRPGDVLVAPAGSGTRYVVREIESDAHEAVFRLRVSRAAAPVGVAV